MCHCPSAALYFYSELWTRATMCKLPPTLTCEGNFENNSINHCSRGWIMYFATIQDTFWEPCTNSRNKNISSETISRRIDRSDESESATILIIDELSLLSKKAKFWCQFLFFVLCNNNKLHMFRFLTIGNKISSLKMGSFSPRLTEKMIM